MLKNYLKIALRNLLRHKIYSTVNITGLAVGMTVCVLILLWVQHQVSFDKFHRNADQIYRLYHHLNIGGNDRLAPMASPPMAPALLENYPEIIDAVRISSPQRVAIRYEDKSFWEDEVIYADNSFFNIFTFPLLHGNPETALVDPYSVVITEDIAGKYFGDENPVGKLLRFDGESDYHVTGVMENPPANSHLSSGVIRSLETLYAENVPQMEIWGYLGYYTYLLLDKNADQRTLESKFPDLLEEKIGERMRAVGATMELLLQPLSQIHLFSNLEGDVASRGNITYVYLFSVIALFVLLIACINFINLSTARSATRAKEVGMRKTFGAHRGRLIRQFLSESIAASCIALLLAMLLIEVTLPLFNSISGIELSLNLKGIHLFLSGMVALAILVGIIAGFYPALILSSYQPVRVLKGSSQAGVSNLQMRRLLVVVQFVISVSLLISTLTIHSQINFMKNKSLGFDKDHVVIIPDLSEAMLASIETVKDEFTTVPGVLGVAASSTIPGRGFGMSNFIPEGLSEDESQLLSHMDVDPELIPTLGLEIAAGRNFSEELTTDQQESAIINETAARRFGWDDPIGKTMQRRVYGPEGPEWHKLNVIGVVKDFHLASLHMVVEPLFIGGTSTNWSSLMIRIAPADPSHTLERLENKWRELETTLPFDYYFLDESLNKQYQGEERVGTISLFFCLLAIFIGSLGLFGLVSFASEQRTKEIGIRKVLGATLSNILALMSREFILLVLVSCVIAVPIAYLAMEQWLQSFAYRVSLNWWVFLIAGVISMMIALLTVSFQSIRAALTDPVASLRYE